MDGIENSIVSSSLPKEDSVLRAIFSQITAEVRKRGIVLGDEEGSFYVSDRFCWRTTVRDFFNVYHRICERKQISPIYQESKLTSSLKVPYAAIETVNLFHDGVAMRLFQFRDCRIPPFSGLSASPSRVELRLMTEASDDEDVRVFLEQILLIDEELRRYVSRLDELAAAYQLRLTAFAEAFAGIEKEDEIQRKYLESKQRIDAVLAPYIGKLKKAGVVPSSWSYSYCRLPLTEEGRRYLSIMTLSSDLGDYWEKDELPLKSVREAAERKRREEERVAAERKRLEEARVAAERKRREEARVAAERKRREEARVAASMRETTRKWKAEKAPRGVELSRPSSWTRFDRRIRRIGDWMAAKIEKVTDWIMGAILILGGILAVAIVISAWVNEGFWGALIVVLIGAASFGVLSLAVGVIAGVAKLVCSVPLYILRFVFYRGWTLVLTLVFAVIAVLYRLVTTLPA